MRCKNKTNYLLNRHLGKIKIAFGQVLPIQINKFKLKACCPRIVDVLSLFRTENLRINILILCCVHRLQYQRATKRIRELYKFRIPGSHQSRLNKKKNRCAQCARRELYYYIFFL